MTAIGSPEGITYPSGREAVRGEGSVLTASPGTTS